MPRRQEIALTIYAAHYYYFPVSPGLEETLDVLRRATQKGAGSCA